jgi:hypothetical protein
MVYDDLSGERRGFGYACSEDGLAWHSGAEIVLFAPSCTEKRIFTKTGSG